MAAAVRKAVESGDYASASDVIRDALRYWKQRGARDEAMVLEFRRLWREGLDSGPAEALGMDGTRREARRRRRARETSGA